MDRVILMDNLILWLNNLIDYAVKIVKLNTGNICLNY